MGGRPCTNLHKGEQKDRTKTLPELPVHILNDYDQTKSAIAYIFAAAKDLIWKKIPVGFFSSLTRFNFITHYLQQITIQEHFTRFKTYINIFFYKIIETWAEVTVDKAFELTTSYIQKGFNKCLLTECEVCTGKYLPKVFIHIFVRKNRRQILSRTDRANEVNEEFIICVLVQFFWSL